MEAAPHSSASLPPRATATSARTYAHVSYPREHIRLSLPIPFASHARAPLGSTVSPLYRPHQHSASSTIAAPASAAPTDREEKPLAQRGDAVTLRQSCRWLLVEAGTGTAATSPHVSDAASACESEMRKGSISRSGGCLARLRNLMAWNRTNAAAAALSSPVLSGASSAPASTGAALDAVEAAVRDRWTCRQFDTAKPIDLGTLKRILVATTRAPTGFNLQGWHAVVVTDRKAREQLFQAALGQPQVLQAPVTVVFVGDMEPERNAPQALEMGLETGYYGPLYGAAYLRNVYYFMHGGSMQSMAAAKSIVSSWYSRAAGTPLVSVPVSRAGYAWKQTMIPAAAFVQLCTAAGWDTCMMEGIDEDAVKRALGVPVGRYTIPVIVSVGYATAAEAEKRQVRSSRFATSHIVRWNTF
ncbi:hypothetical protein LSCM1_07743 [Leishmania martiniquensis]|uniref:Nitroreductase domain-containing protein n=1 Tax=Leishmania martiniquensis TaxID=1580590 RepID=A0A836L389_9TRYP|nr:hypothetical protein LSCM1_07743 [Leishmania martiniquensis]